MKNKILLGVSGVKGVKTIVFLFLSLLMILPLSSCYNKENREEILKVYNWADYIDEDVLANFPKWYEQQTGKKIRVIYQTFDINEVMLTKIERGHESYFIGPLMERGMPVRIYHRAHAPQRPSPTYRHRLRQDAQLYQQRITIHC